MTYTPADLGASVLDGAADVLPWVAAAIGAAIAIMFALVGIRRAVQWARWMIEEREHRRADAVAAAESYFSERDGIEEENDWDDAYYTERYAAFTDRDFDDVGGGVSTGRQ